VCNCAPAFISLEELEEMRQACGLGAAVCAASLLVSSCAGVFAEDTTRVLFLRQDGSEMVLGPVSCEVTESDYGLLPLQGLRNLPLVERSPCGTTESELSVEGKVVLWRFDTMNGLNECQVKDAYDHLEEGSAKMVIFLVPVDWRNFEIEAWIGRRPDKLPGCTMRYRETVESVLKEVSGDVKVEVENGESESLQVMPQNKDTRVQVFADGNLVGSFSLVHESYVVLGFVAENEDGSTPWVKIEVSDGVVSNRNTWVCTDFEKLPGDGADWRTIDAELNMELWSRADVQSWKPKNQRPEVLHDEAEWISAKQASKVACRTERFRHKVKNRGKLFEVVPAEFSFDDAESRCRAIGTSAHLASIHDFRQNRLLRQLLLSSGSGKEVAWIGLADGKWVDHSIVDFLHFSNEPERVGRELACMNIKTTEWEFCRSWEKLFSVCQILTNGGAIVTDGGHCLIFQSDDPKDIQVNAPPRVETSESRFCKFSRYGDLTCCSFEFLRNTIASRMTVLENRLEAFRRGNNGQSHALETSCSTVFEQAVCSDCRADQSSFMFWNDGVTGLAVCQSTCDEIQRSCGDIFSYESSFWCIQLFKEATQLSIEISSDDKNCLILDAEPPKIVETEPHMNWGRVHPDLKELKVTFDSSVRVGNGISLYIVHTYSDRESKEDYRVFDIRLESKFQEKDTIVMKIESVNGSCIFEAGEHMIMIGGGTVFDRAGNTFPGTIGKKPWLLKSTTSCYEQNFTGVSFLVVLCVLGIAGFILLYLRRPHLNSNLFSEFATSGNGSDALGSGPSFQRMDDSDQEMEMEMELVSS